MPNYFQFTGGATQAVEADVQSYTNMNFYFGCWVRIDKANAATPLCLGSLLLGSTTTSGAGIPMAQLWIENNQLNACAVNLAGNATLITSVDTSVIADGTWHHVGFFVGMVPNPLGIPTGLRVNFFKNGQPTNETGSSAATQGASATVWPHISDAELARLPAIDPGTGKWFLTLGPATLSNALTPNPLVKTFNGDMANIVVQTGLLTGPTMASGNPSTDLFSYVAGTYNSIPRSDPMSGTIIALLPGELASGNKAYSNLVTETPLALTLAPPVAYDSATFFDGLSEMALYAPSAPFPGSDTGSDPLSMALVYLVQNAANLNLKDKTLAYLRGTAYADVTFDTAAAIGAPTEGGIFGVTYPGGANFSASDFQSAQTQLQTEFLQVGIAQKYYNAAFAYLGFLQGQDDDNLTTVGLNISSNERAASTSGNIGDALAVISAVMTIVQPEIGAVLDGLVAVINLAGDGGPAAGAQGPLGAFQATFDTLASQVGTAWANSAGALGTNMATILCDWGKLSLIDMYNTNGQFNWPLSGNTVPAGWQAARQIQFMRQLMTATYQDNYLVNNFERPAPASSVDLGIVPSQFQITGSQSLNGFTRAICTIDTSGVPTVTSAPSQTTADYLFTALTCPGAEVWYQWWPEMTPIPIPLA